MAKKSLTRATRRQFIRAAARDGVLFKPTKKGVGWSTVEVARYCVEQKWAPKGWKIGKGYKALVKG